jgi:hypothetical protein
MEQASQKAKRKSQKAKVRNPMTALPNDLAGRYHSWIEGLSGTADSHTLQEVFTFAL